MYSWNIEKKLFFSEKAFVIIISGWLIRIKHYIGVFVLAFPFSFYYSMILMTSLTFFSHKHCTLPTTPEMSKMMTDFCIFLCTNLLKMSCEKRWKWHSWDPKFKNFLGEHAPRPPLGWAGLAFFPMCIHLQNLTLHPWKQLVSQGYATGHFDFAGKPSLSKSLSWHGVGWCVGQHVNWNSTPCWLSVGWYINGISVVSKIQLVVYYQCCVFIDWAITRLYVIAH